ncbi:MULTISPECIES: methyl-accepting chemotaxis protein [Legionella]|uniref:Chemotaxis signal transducer n=1 Tax=Legionella steelei TaxID=947033 RepID=A0A0W0ZIM9_9GAMM|nr:MULTISPECIES: methyl-accepting chemotaxis protein [Legionella]KTD69119.1 chemotaxis signal transducer [Legionella steelei]MBN9225769.1 methyl-accepting chemotaxis protein [Legionella steelei]OJW10621.1 MAG: chemotaxis protein [Legionella sp. 39-23]
MDKTSPHGFIFSIRTRLIIGFMTLCLPVLILVALLLPKINYIMELSQTISRESLPQLLDVQIYETQDILEHWAMTGEPKDKEYFARLWKDINEDRNIWDQRMHSKELDNTELQKKWDKLQEMYGPLYETQAKIINAYRDPNNQNNTEDSRNATHDLISKMIDLIDGQYSDKAGRRVGGLFNNISNEIAKNSYKINTNLDSLKQTAYWLLSLAIALTIIVPYVTQKSILDAVDYAINIAERIAHGERNVPVLLRSTGRLGKLFISLRAMQEAIAANDAALRKKEEESRALYEQLVNSSKKFSEYSSKVAAGDLRERLELDKEEILRDLGQDLNSMTDGLASITHNITTVSNNIVSMVKTVITSADEQAESITSQASAINEISASLEEIDKSSKQTMEKAQTLREVAKNTYEQGKLGTQSVEQSIHGIKASEEKMKLITQTILDLNNRTQQIGDITAVVNTLAQQSKMLALNAAIEASKAGESGKGFAAVAKEVRSLAEQSEQSTVQVQKILEDIRRATEKAVIVTEEGTKTLDSGAKLIEKAGTVIQTLSKMINDASIASQHIEVAIRQEAVGIEQIVESMNEINRTTSTFSIGIKEMMTFIHHLDEIAKQLKNDVDVYKV